MTIRLVFDVESHGLYGEGFAVGWVVLEGDHGRVLEEAFAVSNPEVATGGDGKDVAWLKDNVYPWMRGMDVQFPETGSIAMRDPTTGIPVTVCADHGVLREVFWSVLERWAARDAEVWADVPVPVEANFLRSCVSVSPSVRKWKAPYPLLDVATVTKVASLLRLERLPGELPQHHPLMDARQSGRELLAGLAKLRRPCDA